MRVKGQHAKDHWKLHRAEWTICNRCELHKRAKFRVLGRGRIPSDILFVGLAPGKTEDVTGLPFVGRAGKVLDGWIEDAVGPRSYAITNLVACRPCDTIGGPNRDPTLDEICACADRLAEFMHLVKPYLVVTLGKIAEYGCPTHYVRDLALQHPAYVARVGGVGSAAYETNLEKLRDKIRSVFRGKETKEEGTEA